jgi:hypothetical protein
MAKQPKTYVAPHAVYTGGRMYAPGEPFVTADEPGEQWETVTKGEAAAAEAAQKGPPNDVPLDSLSGDALKAFAATKKVNPKGLSDAELRTAIAAADEPAL